jgi:hypothetical protein
MMTAHTAWLKTTFAAPVHLRWDDCILPDDQQNVWCDNGHQELQEPAVAEPAKAAACCAAAQHEVDCVERPCKETCSKQQPSNPSQLAGSLAQQCSSATHNTRSTTGMKTFSV